MRAVRCCDEKIQVVDVPEPTGSGVRVDVKSASICNGDRVIADDLWRENLRQLQRHLRGRELISDETY